MKTIFRHINVWLLVAAILALGAVAGIGQNPCEDAAGIAALDAKFRENYDKALAERKVAVDAAKQYLEKYGECPASKEFADYLKSNLPAMEEFIKKEEARLEMVALIKRFDENLKTKNWNEVYAAGKRIIALQPDEFRDAELVLASIGLDETAKTPRVTTWNNDTLQYAKMAIADLEANKPFKTYGAGQFTYKNKENALGWMYYTVGYINYFDKNDKKVGLENLYKASQLNSDTKTNPVLYQTIGDYYFDEVRKLAKEVDDMAKGQAETDTPEVAKQKVDAIKAKVALVNGTSEAAINAYAKAHDLAKKNPKLYPAEYTGRLHKILQDLYSVRFGKMDGFDAFIASAATKPTPNPLSPVTPINDAEPSTAASGTAAPAAAKPAEPAPANPSAPAAAKPVATKPVSGTKPAAVAKKAVKRVG